MGVLTEEGFLDAMPLDLYEFIEPSSDPEPTPSSLSPTATAVAETTAALLALQEYIADVLESMSQASLAYSEDSIGSVGTDPFDPVFYEFGSPGYTPTEPDTTPVAFTSAAPTWDDPTVSIGTPPEMDIDIPAFDYPDVPDTSLPAFNLTAPGVTAPAIPAVPSYNLPVMPAMQDLIIPDPPEYTVPEFDFTIPLMDLTPPDSSFVWSEAAYTSQLAAQLSGKLLNDLADGSLSGIAAGTEDDIYLRATNRQEIDNTRMLVSAAGGLSLPAQALGSLQIETQNNALHSRTNVLNDITTNRSVLAQQHKHFVQNLSVDWEKELIDYYDEARGRALLAAKAGVEAMISVYKSKIEGFRGQTDIYSAMADAYRARVSGELAKAEFYRAQIEGKKLTVDAQRAMVMAYNAQIESVQLIAEVYNTQMEAAKIQAEIERIKVEAYTNYIMAFKTQVEVVAARYDIYVAQIRGEESKAKVYQSLAEAYEAQVDAYGAKTQVDIAQAKITIESLKAKVEVYAAQIQKYAANVSFCVGQAEIGVLAQRAANTHQDATQRIPENTMSYWGKVTNSQASETGSALTVNAQISGAIAKLTADLHLLQTKMQAAGIKANARIEAAHIAANTTSFNTSKTDGRSHSFNQEHKFTNYSSNRSRMHFHQGWYHTWRYNR